jgi:hypothetical protein
MTRLPADVSRPAILYVEKVDTSPDIEAYLEKRRLSVIDLELDIIQAKQIIDHLQGYVDGRLGGSVRLRFTGRLIHL